MPFTDNNVVKNGHNRAYPTPESQQQPPPLRSPYTGSLEGYSSYSNAVINEHLRTERTYHTSQTYSNNETDHTFMGRPMCRMVRLQQ